MDNVASKKINKKLLRPDGVITEKTICTFKNIEIPLNNILRLKPQWIGINSLFYDGPLDVLIHIRDRIKNKLKIEDNNPDGDFNIFSIPNLNRNLAKKN